MNTWKVVCATLVIFIAGIITGATLVRFAQARTKQPWQRIQPSIAENRMPSNPAAIRIRPMTHAQRMPATRPAC